MYTVLSFCLSISIVIGFSVTLRGNELGRNNISDELDKSYIGTPWIFHPKSNSIRVGGTVNSNETMFIIDTGARYVFIDNQIANQSKIKLQVSDDDLYTVLGRVKYSKGVADTISVANSPPVRNLSIGLRNKEGVGYSLLGQNALVSMHALLDFNSSKIYFSDVNNMIDVLSISNLNKVRSFDLLRVRNIPVVECFIGGKKARFMVDSGSAASHLDTEFSRKLNLPIHNVNMNTNSMSGRISMHEIALCSDFKIGESKFNEMIFAIFKIPPIKCEDGEPIVGVLGLDFLIATRALLDVTESRIYISEPGVPVFRFSPLPCVIQKVQFFDKLNKSDWVGRIGIDKIEFNSDSSNTSQINVKVYATVLNKLKGDLASGDLKFNLILDGRRFSNKLMVQSFVRTQVARLIFLNKDSGILSAKEEDIWPDDVIINEK